MSEIFKKKSIEDFNLDEIKKDESLVFVDKDCNFSIIDGKTKQIKYLKTKVEEVIISNNLQLQLQPIKYIISGQGSLYITTNGWETGDEAEIFVDTNFVDVSYPSDWIVHERDFKIEPKQYVLKVAKYENNNFIKIIF